MATKKTVKNTTKITNPFVLVVTQCRPWSIVAGRIVERRADGSVVLEGARMIVYFSSDARSVYGAAVHGPGSQARVSPMVARACVRPPEHEIECTEAARTAIEAEPWH